MLTCPHCKQSLTEADLSRQTCPHCGLRVLSGQQTIDTSTGQLTLDLPAQTTQRDSTVTVDSKVTVFHPRLSSTIASADLPASASDPRLSRTIESADLPATGGDPRLSNTIESADL